MLSGRRAKKEAEEDRRLHEQFLASVVASFRLRPGESLIRIWAARWFAFKPELGATSVDQMRNRRPVELVASPENFVGGVCALTFARFGFFAGYTSHELRNVLKFAEGVPLPEQFGPGTPYWSAAKPLLARKARLMFVIPVENLHVLFPPVPGQSDLTAMVAREGVFGILGDSSPEVVAMIRATRDRRREALGLPPMIRAACDFCGNPTAPSATRCPSCGAPMMD